MKIANFKIEEWMNVYETSAKYNLMTTCIAPLSISELFRMSGLKLTTEILSKKLDYGDITGSTRLKSLIKDLYTNQNIENITITHGAIGANQLVFLSLLEKGDEVISIVPTYQQHYSIPESLGCNVKLFYLNEENNWLPDIDKLANTITSKTKLLCLNNPNNPTGSVISDRCLERIVEIAKRNNVWILSDEAYRGLNLYENPYSQSISDLYEKGISVGTMSKTYSLPGIRLGWISARKDLINDINKQRQYNTISVSILDDYLASVALENREFIQQRNFEIMRRGINVLEKWLVLNPDVHCIVPTGGTTALLKYNLDMSSRKFCQQLQKYTGVALLPGETFEMEGYVRLGFCADNLSEALELVEGYRRNYVCGLI